MSTSNTTRRCLVLYLSLTGHTSTDTLDVPSEATRPRPVDTVKAMISEEKVEDYDDNDNDNDGEDR